jgi:hypothetical protein
MVLLVALVAYDGTIPDHLTLHHWRTLALAILPRRYDLQFRPSTYRRRNKHNHEEQELHGTYTHHFTPFFEDFFADSLIASASSSHTPARVLSIAPRPAATSNDRDILCFLPRAP